MATYIRLADYKNSYKKIIKKYHNTNTLVHLGTRTFEDIGGEVAQSVANILEKGKFYGL